jgi:hypothetical protein
LRNLFTYESLCNNDFLLKKFDIQGGYINTYWLARENTLRPFLNLDPEGKELDTPFLEKVGHHLCSLP